jgi:hypothetical protein
MPPEPAHRLAYSPIWRPSTTRSGHIPHWLCLLPHGLRSPFRRLRLDERASSGKPKIHPAFLRVRFSGMGSTSSSCSLAYVMLPPSGVNFSSAPPRPTILARVPDGNGQRTVCLPARRTQTTVRIESPLQSGPRTNHTLATPPPVFRTVQSSPESRSWSACMSPDIQEHHVRHRPGRQ